MDKKELVSGREGETERIHQRRVTFSKLKAQEGVSHVGLYSKLLLPRQNVDRGLADSRSLPSNQNPLSWREPRVNSFRYCSSILFPRFENHTVSFHEIYKTHSLLEPNEQNATQKNNVLQQTRHSGGSIWLPRRCFIDNYALISFG